MDELFGIETGWQSAMDSFQELVVDLQMPRFSASYGAKCLKTKLREMGMKEAFSDTAEFDRITDTNVGINTVLHMATIDVDEQGTVAAASTLVAVSKGAQGVGQTQLLLQIDRPFLFVVYDRFTQTTIFCAKIETVSGDTAGAVGDKRPRDEDAGGAATQI